MTKRKRSTEDSPLEECLRASVQKQLEHYMGDHKLLLDPRLRQAAINGPSGAVRIPVRLLLRRQRLRRIIGNDFTAEHSSQLVRAACAQSTLIQYSEAESGEGHFIVRANGLPELRRAVFAVQCTQMARLMTPLRSESPEAFTVMSYNLLADHLASPRLFEHVQMQWLRWQHRGSLIRRLIKFHRPSLLCVQVRAPGHCSCTANETAAAQPMNRCSVIAHRQ